jgi:hypothetical protein
MTTKLRVRFSVSESDQEFLEKYQVKNNLKYLSDTLSVLITDYATLKQQLEQKQNEIQRVIKISRAAARDAHLSLLLLSNASREFEHQLFNPNDSSMLKDAREYYQKELQAARTKKSHPKSEPGYTVPEPEPFYVDDDDLF